MTPVPSSPPLAHARRLPQGALAQHPRPMQGRVRGALRLRGLARGPWLALRRSAGGRGRIPAGAVWTVSELRTERDAQDGNVARPGAPLATQPATRFH